MGVALGVKASGTRAEHPTVTQSVGQECNPTRKLRKRSCAECFKTARMGSGSKSGAPEVFCPPWLNFSRQMLFSTAQT